jgi:hypothetical protein
MYQPSEVLNLKFPCVIKITNKKSTNMKIYSLQQKHVPIKSVSLQAGITSATFQIPHEPKGGNNSYRIPIFTSQGLVIRNLCMCEVTNH